MARPQAGPAPARIGYWNTWGSSTTRASAASGSGPDRLDRELGGLGGGAPDLDATRLERLPLRLGGPRGTGDDRPGVAHLLAGRRGEPGDVGDHRLGDPLSDEVGGALLGVAANLAHDHDQLRLRVLLEQGEDVDEVRADDRVA